MNTIYIIPIEPIDQRYTKQWYDNIPLLLNEAIQEHNLDYTVKNIDGVTLEGKTTSGAFLDFGQTNQYKASQTAQVSELFSQGLILPGDKFLITDAWNFIVTPIKYMSELLDIPVEIHGIWHAGAYDPTDILGLKMSKPWPHLQEQAWFMACDYNYFGTNFHKDMFLENLQIPEEYHYKAIRSGQPHTPIVEQLEPYYNNERTNAGTARRPVTIILWPHRYNEDKQPEIIEDMKGGLANKVLMTQNMNLTKEKYYKVLGETTIVFSSSLHENLGISMMEGCLAGAIPIVPDRASYTEMYLRCFKYPSHWTESFSAYKKQRKNLCDFIVNLESRYDDIKENELKEQVEILKRDYLSADIMINNILDLDKN